MAADDACLTRAAGAWRIRRYRFRSRDLSPLWHRVREVAGDIRPLYIYLCTLRFLMLPTGTVPPSAPVHFAVCLCRGWSRAALESRSLAAPSLQGTKSAASQALSSSVDGRSSLSDSTPRDLGHPHHRSCRVVVARALARSDRVGHWTDAVDGGAVRSASLSSCDGKLGQQS